MAIVKMELRIIIAVSFWKTINNIINCSGDADQSQLF
jgi:hypothetical protein